MRSLAGFLVAVLLVGQGHAQGRFKPPAGPEEKIAKFHSKRVLGTPAAERMRAYQQRLSMEAESPFGNIKWRSVGPEHQGGRVIALVSSPGRSSPLYAAYATGGLWRTADGGVSWTSLFDNESAFAIGDVQVSKDGQTLWVGTGENNSQRTSYSGTGVFKSTDAGATWTHVGLEETHRIGRIVLDRTNENTVYVAAIGALYSDNPERGVYKTTDGGKSWSHVLKLGDRTGAIDLIINPRNPRELLAAAWTRNRRAWDFQETGEGSGIYRSADGGKTWTLVQSAPHGLRIGRIGLAASESRPGVAYALIDHQGPDELGPYRDERIASGVLTPKRFAMLQTADQFAEIERSILVTFFARYLPSDWKVDDVLQKIKDRKVSLDDIAAAMEQRNPRVFELETVDSVVYRTDDFGKTWRRMSSYIGTQLGYYCGRIFVNPKREDDVVILGLVALRSQDSGRTWKQVARQNHVDHHAWWFDPNDPENHWANGNDGGVYITRDADEHWMHVENCATGQFTTLAIDNSRPYNLVGGLQDNGTQFGPSTYRPGQSGGFFGGSGAWRAIGGGDGSAVAFDPRDNGVVYIASQFGAHQAINLKTNERWNTRPSLREPGVRLRFNWVSPCIVSPHHPDILYIGANYLFRSLNQGRDWEVLSGDLTKNLPVGDVPFGTIKDISESPFKFGLIYVGCDDGTVKMTRDHGASWVDISTPQPDKWVSRVVASKWKPGRVYVAQSGYREDDWSAYLWKSEDYGKTWTSIADGLPMETINVVREDPNKEGWLYVGTDLGVFVSMDDGKTWTTLHGGIPRAPVHDLQVQVRDSELVIATHSRSCWILDLKPLYDLSDEIRKQDLYLWDVPNMTRGAGWGYRYRATWSDEPLDAPVVNVKAWVKSRGPGTLRLKTKDGKAVLEKSVTALTGYNFFALELMTRPQQPRAVDQARRKIEKGQDAVKDPFEAERAQYVPAGEYVIELEVGGKTVTKPWTLTPG